MICINSHRMRCTTNVNLKVLKCQHQGKGLFLCRGVGALKAVKLSRKKTNRMFQSVLTTLHKYCTGSYIACIDRENKRDSKVRRGEHRSRCEQRFYLIKGDPTPLGPYKRPLGAEEVSQRGSYHREIFAKGPVIADHT